MFKTLKQDTENTERFIRRVREAIVETRKTDPLKAAMLAASFLPVVQEYQSGLRRYAEAWDALPAPPRNVWGAAVWAVSNWGKIHAALTQPDHLREAKEQARMFAAQWGIEAEV